MLYHLESLGPCRDQYAKHPYPALCTPIGIGQVLEWELTLPTDEVQFQYSKLGETICGCGSLKLLLSVMKQPKYSVGITILIDKSGACSTSHVEAMGKLIGLALTAGVKTEEIIKHLENQRCPKGISCADAVSKILVRIFHPLWIRKGTSWDKYLEEHDALNR